MNHNDLKKIHKDISKEDFSNVHDFKHVFIGQAVKYSKQSFLRLAIGAKNIRKFIEEDEVEFNIDKTILRIIENKLVDHFENNFSISKDYLSLNN